ncbi:hypothetical protein ABZ876_13340 [Streptomyces sp. NPDC046931]|uniref:hypothetical protein n=1 Tax=Streptomyces sp. NPDC046931 TaxID=3154806 RepID=UPI0033C55484
MTPAAHTREPETKQSRRTTRQAFKLTRTLSKESGKHGPGLLTAPHDVATGRSHRPTATTAAGPAGTTSTTGVQRAVAPSFIVRGALISSLIGGLVGAVMSALANYVVVGMPATSTTNAVNHAVSGLISGFLACLFGVLEHHKKADRATALPDGHDAAAPAVDQFKDLSAGALHADA